MHAPYYFSPRALRLHSVFMYIIYIYKQLRKAMCNTRRVNNCIYVAVAGLSLAAAVQ